MNEADWTLVALVGASVLLGLARGVVRELLALAGWVVAMLLALAFAKLLGAWLPLEPMAPAVRTGLAGLLIVVVSLLVAALIGAVLRSLMVAVKLSTEDRLLGGLFGLLRGVLVVGALVLFAGLTAAPAQAWWRDSLLLPRLQAVVQWLQPWLPASLVGTAQGL